MNEICEKYKCTGCFACKNACDKNAINMSEFKPLGDIYPKIDQNKCINCKKCQTHCPELKDVQMNMPIECYAAYAKDKEIYKSSSSGGIAYLISSHFLMKKAVVYTCVFNKRSTLEYTRISSFNKLKKTQGSKYTHSHIGLCLKQIKNDLNNGIEVLFIGSPCQCAGLFSFLHKPYNNLTTIDFVCHGMPSQYLLKTQVDELTGESKNVEIKFRTQEKHYPFTFTILKNNMVRSWKWYKNPYFYSFMKGVSYRESCYNCRYANINRVSDITLGDFWGLSNNSPVCKSASTGVSLVLINTKHGESIFSKILPQVYYDQRPISEAVNGNEQLKACSQKTNKRNKFILTFLKTNNIFKAYRKTFVPHYIKYLFFK